MKKLGNLLGEILSSEWILTRGRMPNGGSVIFLRTLLTGFYLFGLSLFLINVIDPSRNCIFSLHVLLEQVVDKLAWMGVIFAFVYTALYARFSSQWSYIAGLYNQIKQAECEIHNAEAMAEWKAGFMEDAENLHLATKDSVASIIHVWGKRDLVKQKFIDHTPGKLDRYERLMKSVEDKVNEIDVRYRA